MECITSYKRTVGLITLLSGLIAMLSNLLLALSVNFNFEAFADADAIFSMTGVDTTHMKAGLIADMFGFYLLLLPAVYYLHIWMKDHTHWSYVASFCGASYILIGAIGAAVLATAWPAILKEYDVADALAKQSLRADFNLLKHVVCGGLWNTLEVLLAGAWWLVIGKLLFVQYKFFGSLTILLGIVCLLDAIGNITGMQVMSAVSLNIYLGLAPAWAVWLGLTLLIYKIQYAA